jgi:predicted pyridoxine 5'-phosphate oxidase superfamily flavin-nucleotide-binding protein
MVQCPKTVFPAGRTSIIAAPMPHRFAELAFTPAVKAVQERQGSRESYERFAARSPANDRLGPDEVAFLAERDSFYMATVSETSWPYVQHRGGPPGFVRVLDERTIALADFRGNRQYVSVGNLAGDGRVALIFMDYVHQRRLKVLGRARVVEIADDPALLARLALPGYDARVERAMAIAVEAFDWNCPQHITPRFTEPEILQLVAPLRARVAELEAEVGRLRKAAAGSGPLDPQQ